MFVSEALLGGFRGFQRVFVAIYWGYGEFPAGLKSVTGRFREVKGNFKNVSGAAERLGGTQYP